MRHSYRGASKIDRIHYYRVLAELRVVILGHRSTSKPDLLSEVGNSLLYGLLHRRLLTEALSDVLGIALPAISLPEPEPGQMDWLYGAAPEQIRQNRPSQQRSVRDPTKQGNCSDPQGITAIRAS
jgi:hypothetical protein